LKGLLKETEAHHDGRMTLGVCRALLFNIPSVYDGSSGEIAARQMGAS
jgi:hypothetical protein